MSSETVNDSQPIRYGNLRRPKLPGLFGFGALPSGILVLGAIVMMMLIFLVNLWVALIWIGFVLFATLPAAIKTRDGVSYYTKWLGSRRYRRSVKTKKNLLSQGLTGLVPTEDCHLPGVAAPTQLTSEYDVHGREFGLISWPQSDLYSVVIQCFPPGSSGLDRQVLDMQVEQWAAWMSQLNTIGEVVGASVVIESAPDSGQRLRRAIDRGRAAEAPEYSVAMAAEMKESSRAGAPIVSAKITLTFNARLKGDDGETSVRSREQMAKAIGDVLPTLTGTLDGTGAGQGSYPCVPQEIIDSTRVAYDPAVAPLVEEAQVGDGTGLTWDQAGPITAKNHFDYYQHETAVSRTWQMREIRGTQFYDKILEDLMAPHRDVARKRVVLVYRPEPAERSMQIAENDVTAARLVRSQNPRAKAAHQLAVEAAEKTALQEALGSPLIRVGLLVTITVLDPAQLDQASRVITSTLAPRARLKMRLPRGTQDAAFVAALPLGMVPYYHADLTAFADGM